MAKTAKRKLKTLVQDGSCAAKLKVLADPTRLAVLDALRGGPRNVGELMKMLKIEQSLLSHHLKALRDAALVASTREGKGVTYRLTAATGEGGVDLGCCRLSFE